MICSVVHLFNIFVLTVGLQKKSQGSPGPSNSCSWFLADLILKFGFILCTADDNTGADGSILRAGFTIIPWKWGTCTMHFWHIHILLNLLGPKIHRQHIKSISEKRLLWKLLVLSFVLNCYYFRWQSCFQTSTTEFQFACLGVCSTLSNKAICHMNSDTGWIPYFVYFFNIEGIIYGSHK